MDKPDCVYNDGKRCVGHNCCTDITCDFCTKETQPWIYHDGLVRKIPRLIDAAALEKMKEKEHGD